MLNKAPHAIHHVLVLVYVTLRIVAEERTVAMSQLIAMSVHPVTKSSAIHGGKDGLLLSRLLMWPTRPEGMRASLLSPSFTRPPLVHEDLDYDNAFDLENFERLRSLPIHQVFLASDYVWRN
ncbi:hypothetical protein PG996_007008 [Apiospora saccharicola]|uniref:Uncharacterized protein n=1 Tax=Apiospora saccharicola TaxID=335842 RepID=A0ABR1VC29_9PEZI